MGVVLQFKARHESEREHTEPTGQSSNRNFWLGPDQLTPDLFSEASQGGPPPCDPCNPTNPDNMFNTAELFGPNSMFGPSYPSRLAAPLYDPLKDTAPSEYWAPDEDGA